MVSKDEDRLPLVINCWPSLTGSETIVNIEYESPGLCDLQNVVVAIPLPQLQQPPRVAQADGSHRWESRRNVLFWQASKGARTSRVICVCLYVCLLVCLLVYKSVDGGRSIV